MAVPGPNDAVYRIAIGGVTIEHFSSIEMDKLQGLIAEVSVMDCSHLYAIWFHVRSQNGRTLHLPHQMAENLFYALGTIVNNRRFSQVPKEALKNDHPEGEEDSEDPRVVEVGIDAG